MELLAAVIIFIALERIRDVLKDAAGPIEITGEAQHDDGQRGDGARYGVGIPEGGGLGEAGCFAWFTEKHHARRWADGDRDWVVFDLVERRVLK